MAHTSASNSQTMSSPLWSRILIVVYITIGIIYSYLLIYFIQADGIWTADFSAFYTAWRMVLDGQGASLYDFTLQESYQQEILAGNSFAGGLLPFVNPPHVAVLFAPLGLLPLEYAYITWMLLQCGLLIWLLLLLRQLASDWQPYERYLLLSATVAFPPLFSTFLLGAFSLWGLLCIVQFVVLLKQTRDVSAGFWISLGTTKPHLVLLPGISLLAGRRWYALAVAAITSGSFFVFSSLLLGWHIWGDFLLAVRASTTAFEEVIWPGAMYNFRGVLVLWLDTEQGALINQISLLALGIAAAGVLWLWRGTWQPDSPDFELRLALTITLGVLFSPHLYPHDSLVMVAPAVLMYRYIRRYRPEHRTRYAGFILIWPPLFMVTMFIHIYETIKIHPPTIGIGVLAGWSLLELWRHRQERGRSTR